MLAKGAQSIVPAKSTATAMIATRRSRCELCFVATTRGMAWSGPLGFIWDTPGERSRRLRSATTTLTQCCSYVQAAYLPSLGADLLPFLLSQGDRLLLPKANRAALGFRAVIFGRSSYV